MIVLLTTHLRDSRIFTKMKSNKTRVAKMEAGSSIVSIDLPVKLHFSLGVKKI
jgi:hypothetical protein